ncbi:ATP-dependent Clp protease proteolytic subunit [Undibacterium sp. TJN19]|uniref:ATP-dependent Clp protease proteolytic subunit n=1 Tax=Undibacterium sp. TJN19 TaxID=3413055 RepID=UPI003BEF86B4
MQAAIFFSLLVLSASFLTAPASAMSMVRSNETLILFGGVEPSDAELFRKNLEKGPVKHVLLSESPGGDMGAAFAIAGLIKENKINTIVRGNCYSSCAIIFMAGVERQMLAGKALPQTRLGFHGPHQKQTKEVLKAAIPQLREWLLKVTNGKFPQEILDRAMYINRAGDMLLFYYPNQSRFGDIRFCTEGSLRCDNIEGYDIVSIGILTTADLVDVNSLSQPAAPVSKAQE